MKKTKIDLKSNLSFIALILVFLTIPCLYLGNLMQNWIAIFHLLAIILPITGVILGIISFIIGKGTLTIYKKIAAIMAIIIPISVITLFMIIYIGAVTGIISLM